jgi:hypothetical protein
MTTVSIGSPKPGISVVTLELGSLQAGIDLENRTQTLSSFTGHLGEAVLAFQEKRPPNFDSDA